MSEYDTAPAAPSFEREPARRGTTNGNARGGSQERRRRREWLVDTWRADVDLPDWHAAQHGATNVPLGAGVPACRCYRCGALLTVETVSADRIKPGCQGGTYRRENIRPACLICQSVVGGATRRKPITGGAVRGSPTSGKAQTMPYVKLSTNGRSRARFVNDRPAPDQRRNSACRECGSAPGFACNTLTSVRQVKAGKEGAYLKPMAGTHRGRGR